MIRGLLYAVVFVGTGATRVVNVFVPIYYNFVHEIFVSVLWKYIFAEWFSL